MKNESTASAIDVIKMLRDINEEYKVDDSVTGYISSKAAMVFVEYCESLEAQNKLLKDCLKDYVESCEGFGHKPHCCCLPAKECLSSLLP